MDLAKCLRCGNFFTRLKLPVCHACESQEDQEILAVQSFMRDHPEATLSDASDDLQIYLEDIERWISEKRLTVIWKDANSIRCFVCGAPIVTGRICNVCNEKLFSKPAIAPASPPPASPLRDHDEGEIGGAKKYRRG
jgi:hypothetical protein